MDIKILTWTGDIGSFSFNAFDTVVGIEQLKQTVLIEFLSSRDTVLEEGSDSQAIFSEVNESTAAAIADDVVATINTNILADQFDVIRPDERLSEVSITSFSKLSSGGWKIALHITSEAGETVEANTTL